MSEYIVCHNDDKNSGKILDLLETVIQDFPEGLQGFELHFFMDEVLIIKNMYYYPKTKDKTIRQMLCKAKVKAVKKIKGIRRFLGDFIFGELDSIVQASKEKDIEIDELKDRKLWYDDVIKIKSSIINNKNKEIKELADLVVLWEASYTALKRETLKVSDCIASDSCNINTDII